MGKSYKEKQENERHFTAMGGDSKENKEWTSEKNISKVTFVLPNWVVHG